MRVDNVGILEQLRQIQTTVENLLDSSATSQIEDDMEEVGQESPTNEEGDVLLGKKLKKALKPRKPKKSSLKF